MNANICTPTHFSREDSEGLFCSLFPRGPEVPESRHDLGSWSGEREDIANAQKSVQRHKTFATAFLKV